MRDVWNVLFPLLVLALLVAGIWYLLRGHLRPADGPASTRTEPQEQHVPVQKGEVVLDVSEPGVVEYERIERVAAVEGGKLLAVEVEVGQRVKEGQVLVRLDETDAQEELETLKAELERAELVFRELREKPEEIDLLRAEAEVLSAREAQELADRELELKRELLAQGKISAEELERKQAAAHMAELKLKIALAAQAKLKQGARRIEIIDAQERVRKLKTAVCKQQEKLPRYRVRAPIDGKLLELYVDQREVASAHREARMLSPGTVVAQLADTTKLRIITKVFEQDRFRVHAGQAVELSVGDEEPTFTGQVKRVNDLPERLMNLATYPAVIEASQPEQELRPGQSVRCRIIIARRQGALFLPRGALFRRGGQWAVRVQRNEGAEMREVKVGLLGSQRAEILAGVAEGELVLLGRGKSAREDPLRQSVARLRPAPSPR